MGFETHIVEMRSFATVLAVGCREGVGVRVSEKPRTAAILDGV
jgi:hypothetical protein